MTTTRTQTDLLGRITAPFLASRKPVASWTTRRRSTPTNDEPALWRTTGAPVRDTLAERSLFLLVAGLSLGSIGWLLLVTGRFATGLTPIPAVPAGSRQDARDQVADPSGRPRSCSQTLAARMSPPPAARFQVSCSSGYGTPAQREMSPGRNKLTPLVNTGSVQ